MTQTELADASGVTPALISAIERGQSTRLDTIGRITGALRVPLSALVDDGVSVERMALQIERQRVLGRLEELDAAIVSAPEGPAPMDDSIAGGVPS